MNILITGISGFVGSYLAEYLIEKFPDAAIYGTIRWRSRTENLIRVNGKIKLIECDLKDFSSVKSACHCEAGQLKSQWLPAGVEGFSEKEFLSNFRKESKNGGEQLVKVIE